MKKFLIGLGIAFGAYLMVDVGVILGTGFTKDIYEGDIVLDDGTKTGKMAARAFEVADAVYTKVLG